MQASFLSIYLMPVAIAIIMTLGLLAASALSKSVVAFLSGGAGYGVRVALGLAALVLAAAASVAFL